MRRALGLLLLAGCSDYRVHGNEGPAKPFDSADGFRPDVHTGDVESGRLPSCDDAEAPDDYAVEIDASCVSATVPGTFTPVVEWQWTGSTAWPEYDQVMMTPAVVDVSEDGVPDVVFVSFGPSGDRGTGVLRAVDGASGAEHWALLAGLGNITGVSGIGAGDADADGHVELYLCAGGGLLSVDHDGAERWLVPGLCESGEDNPSLHDLEGDGVAEIIVGRSVVEPDGTLRWTGALGRGGSGGYGAMSFAADVDGDGVLEVVTGNTVYQADGSVRWTSSNPDGQPAIADFEGDGVPDLVVTTPGGMYRYDAATGAPAWGPVASVGGGWGGPPTIADFDGDGVPEIGVAELTRYVVREADGSTLWAAVTQENSVSITGSAVFDFEGDGAAEVLYADETTLWILSGVDGSVRLAVGDQASATVSEYPLAVDVDGDDEAEIVLGSNDYYLSGWTGITVIGDADHSWVDAGRAWNQHAYHVAHVEDDGAIPAAYLPSWLDQNTFRAGRVEGPPTAALPDVRPGSPRWCEDTCAQGEVTGWFSVESPGTRDADGVVVELTRAEGSVIARETMASLPAGAARWIGPYTLRESAFPVRLAVDADAALAECDDADAAGEYAWPCE